jgi:protein TonB
MASVVVHTLAIGVAVASTGMSRALPTRSEHVDIVYKPPVPPSTPTPTYRRTGGGSSDAGAPPAIPAPVLDIPDPTLPAPDLVLRGTDGSTELTRGSFSTSAAPPARAVDDDARPFDVATVEQAVVPRAGNPEPRYPSLLSRAGVEGMVVVRFVVDTLGGVESESVRVLSATHEQFARAVREVLPRMRFVPAEVGGRRVRQLVEQRFGFELRQR